MVIMIIMIMIIVIIVVITVTMMMIMMMMTMVMKVIIIVITIIIIISRSTTYDITDDSFGAWLVVRCGWVALSPAGLRRPFARHHLTDGSRANLKPT